jgi:hypothetical protein
MFRGWIGTQDERCFSTEYWADWCSSRLWTTLFSWMDHNIVRDVTEGWEVYDTNRYFGNWGINLASSTSQELCYWSLYEQNWKLVLPFAGSQYEILPTSNPVRHAGHYCGLFSLPLSFVLFSCNEASLVHRSDGLIPHCCRRDVLSSKAGKKIELFESNFCWELISS